MTPLAQAVARELTLPVAKRSFNDEGRVLPLFGQDMHCFEVSAISKTVNDAMDAENLWPDVETMLPAMFLPSPVTWLEMVVGSGRIGLVLQEVTGQFKIDYVCDRRPDPCFSLPLCQFRARGKLEAGDRIELTPGHSMARASLLEREYERGQRDGENLAHEFSRRIGNLPLTANNVRMKYDLLSARQNALHLKMDQANRELDIFSEDGMLKRFVGMAVLMLDLINTPGLVGLRQHDAHRGLAKQLQKAGVGGYPLRGWSEVVVKTHTQVADGCQETGAHCRKCLHFVRSHKRHYRDGRVTVIPAHWRGDPALGIKRTRYTVRSALAA